MRVSFWLIPAEPFRSELAAIIRDLARRFEAPVFTPHVTLYSGMIDKSTNPQDILDAVTHVTRTLLSAEGSTATQPQHPGEKSSPAGTNQNKPLQLTTTGISFTQQFTKTLFIQFASNRQLTLISETIRMSSSAREPYDFHPHLSLLYATMDETTQRDLARSLTPPSRILFDSLQAVETGDTNRTAADVERWTVLATTPIA